ncbi:PAS domain-containing protein, partial [Kitasatospora griseola]|uniref:PAS domain-containing protein n=1 Tax=Kitasatospora griseola TaxID=2064 RepID=UPI0027E3C270
DALCRLLGRPRATLRQQRFVDLVHPDDLPLLLRASAEGGSADVRLSRRDGGYQWVRLRNSVVADATEGPSLLLTVVEDIADWKAEVDMSSGTGTVESFTTGRTGLRPPLRYRPGAFG